MYPVWVYNNYSKTSGRLYECYGDEPNDNITSPKPFKSKLKLTVNTNNDGYSNLQIAVTLKMFREAL